MENYEKWSWYKFTIISLLNKTKGNTIFLYTFIYLKNYVWTFHFFFLIIILKEQARSENWWKKRERKVIKTKEKSEMKKKKTQNNVNVHVSNREKKK